MVLQFIGFEELLLSAPAQSGAIKTDSRQVEHGDIFVVLPPTVQGGANLKAGESVPGGNSGGDQYLHAAICSGAAYIVCAEDHVPMLNFLCEAEGENGRDVIACLVPSTRKALGQLALAAHKGGQGYPALVGITGTNGKTTISYLLEHLFSGLWRKTGVIGTISYRWPGFTQAAPLTTPGCLQLHSLMGQMAGAGVDVAIMEVSSHALEQERVAGLNFRAAIFTNLTQDHLDYHGDMENYYQAKARLFQNPEEGGVPVKNKLCAINADDHYGRRMLEECALRGEDSGVLVAYSFKGLEFAGARTLHGRIVESSIKGLTLEMNFEGQSWQLRSPLVGAFNAYNLLAVQALALGGGADAEGLACLENFTGVPGRLQRVENEWGLNIFVDYAHTPDALVNVQTTLREVGKGRLITVFGCGGNRDSKKRPIMGQAVAEYSDVAVLTSDNPRREKPEDIMADVFPGLIKAKEIHQNPDRRAAIAKALSLLGPEDTLLIAGKGHEDYQIIGDEKFPFDDREVVKEALKCL